MSTNIFEHNYQLNRQQREVYNGHAAKVIWFTGLSGSGKSTYANALEKELFKQGIQTYVLDGDNIRRGLNHDLDFSREGRRENLRRVAEVAKLMLDAGVVILAAFITPLEEDREMIQHIIGEEDLLNIYIDCPLSVCERRDVKGLYQKARTGEIPDFTGISAPYEIPKTIDLILDSDNQTMQNNLNDLLTFVQPLLELK
ncbi:MAG: adenylyl-sulfate kinase [Weeksellaceae bacterium]